MKLIKLTKLTRKPHGETIYVNPQLISVIEEVNNGSHVHIAMSKLVYLVKEAPDKINKLINNGGWNMTYTYDNAQTNAQQTQDNAL